MADKSNDPSISLEDLKHEPQTIDNKWRLFEARYAYAWDYFDFHAKQRTTVFNFFLIVAGLFVNAYITAFKDVKPEDGYVLMTILAMAGALITVFFAFLDRRNEELVHIAEDVLESLETDVLFAGYERPVLFPRRRTLLGRMKIEKGRRSRKLGILMRQAIDDADEQVGRSKFSHGTWLPLLQYQETASSGISMGSRLSFQINHA